MPENYIVGAALTLKSESGKEETLTLRQLRVRDYPKTAKCLEDGDEIQAVANAFEMPRSWAESLTPESYQQASEAFYAVNGSFFSYAGRAAMVKKQLQEASRSQQPSQG